MLYKDLEDLIVDKKIKEGDTLWITDFRFGSDGALNKPIRHVKPTKVKLVSNSELPKNKTVYYSNYHFRPINKNGETSKSRIIAPYDNTGYRSYTGVSLNIFTDEKECKDFYIDLCKNRLVDIDIEKRSILRSLNTKEEEINKLIEEFK